MAVFLSPVFGVAGQLFDDNGNPLAGGKIYTYLAGTTTPAATYTSSSGSIAHTNPIVLDGAGRVPSGEIWLTDGISYKFVVEDANNVLIGTYDNLVGINSNFVAFTNEQEIQTATAGQTVFNLTTVTYQPGTNSLSVFVDGVNQYGPGAQYAYVETDADTVTFVSGLHVGASVKFTTSQLNTSGAVDASQVTYTPPFPNSVATDVEIQLSKIVFLTDFGADDTGVINAATAINNAFNSGAKVIYAVGTYLISANVTLPSGISFVGWPRAEIVSDGGGNFIVTGNSSIENIDFNWSNTARRVYGDNASNITFKNCVSYDSTNNGFDLFNGPVDLTFENCIAHDNGGYGIAALGSTTQRPNRITVQGCKAYRNFYDGICVAGVGERTSPAQTALYARNVVISDCIANENGFGNTAFNGITFPYSQFVTMSNCVTYDNIEHGVALQETSDFAISNCVSYDNGQAGLCMQSGFAPNRATQRGVVTGFNSYNNANEGLALKEKCEEIIFSGSTFSNNVQFSIRLRDLAGSGLKSNAITFIGCAIEPSPGSGFVNSNSSTAVTSGSNLNFDGTTLQPNAMINASLATALTIDTRGATFNFPEFFLLTDSGTQVSRTALNQAYLGRRIILMADSGGAVAIRHNQGDGVNFAGFILQAAATVTLGAFESFTFVGNGVNWIQVADNT